MRKCNENIKDTIELAEKMIKLAQKGDEFSEDDGCGVLYGVLRDAGYKIKTIAERERDSHILSGKWEQAEDLLPNGNEK